MDGNKKGLHMKRVQGYADILGTTITNDRVNFAVSVPTGKMCKLLLYKSGEALPATTFELSEKEGIGEVRFLALADFAYEEYEYNYQIGDAIVVDPYAKELAGKSAFGVLEKKGIHTVRSKIGAGSYDWKGDRPLQIPYSEVIAYALHIRGFTMHTSSKVKHKGTFAGVAEKIPYFKELRINQIQCMPIYEFEECQKNQTNYWGYGSAYYFAPKASYASTGNAMCELKDMVRSCHAAGIEVVLDLPFEAGTHCFLVEMCLQYYVTEYHIDGFILNPYNAPMQSIYQNPLLKNTKIMKKEDGFQNVMRRFLKGDEGMVHNAIWALRHNTKEDGVCNYITNQTGFTLHDLVSYDSKHNELNGEHNEDGPDYNYSWNCGAEGPTRRKTVVALRKNQIKNAFFLLLIAQGTPCILAGDEFANSQKGNNNAYCQDNEISWLNWNNLKRECELFEYVKSLIALRMSHPVLHKSDALLGLDQTACGIPDVSYHGESAWQIPSEVSSRQLGILYCSEGMNDDDCFVAYNMHWLVHSFALPSLTKRRKWYLIVKTNEGILEAPRLLKNQKELEIDARSIVMLIGK